VETIGAIKSLLIFASALAYGVSSQRSAKLATRLPALPADRQAAGRSDSKSD